MQIKINTPDNLNSGEIRNDAKDVPKGPDIPYVPTPDSPVIRTTAVDSETGNHISEADKSVTIIDTVSCWNLIVGREYVLKGVLMSQATGEKLLIDDKPVTSEIKFIPTTANGSVKVKFTFDGSKLDGTSVVVFEELFLLTDLDNDGVYEKEVKVAEHCDITDEGQTVLMKVSEIPEKPEEPVEEPKQEEPETPMEEPENPKPTTNVPKTGDSTVLGLWILLLAASGSALLILRRKENE